MTMAQPTPPSTAPRPDAGALPPAADAAQRLDGTTWVDVAPLLAAACDAMEPDQLVQHPSFSLFESVSAIEIGNPRMDAGADPSCRTAEALAAAGAAPAQLSDAQMLAVMDRLAAAEAAWHAGQFLPQSVYTCLYMLLPDRAQEMLPLAAFCKAVRATCNTVRSLTLASNVCMDEDLIPHACGLEVEDHHCIVGGSARCLAALSLAEDRLNAGPWPAAAPQHSTGSSPGQQHRPHGASGSGAQHGQHGQQADGAADGAAASRSGADRALRAALLARLRFRRHLHKAMERLQGFAAAPDLDAAAKLLVAAQGELQRMRDSAGLAQHDDVVAACFDASVNLRQMAPTPPRSMPVPSVEEAWRHYEGLLARLQAVCRLSGTASWRSLQAFLRDFADKLPGSIERAALHYVLRGGKQAGGKQAPAAAGPPWVPRPELLAAATGLPPGDICAEATTFLEQATIVAQNWCQAMCLNPARTRRRLRRLLQDWHNLAGHAALADQAAEVEAALHAAGWRWQGLGADDPQGLLGTWVEVETAGAMLQHLSAGCAQQLYAPREFCMLYWYCDYLHGIMLEGCHALTAAAPGRQTQQQQQQQQQQQKDQKGQKQGQKQRAAAAGSRRDRGGGSGGAAAGGGGGKASSKAAQAAAQQAAEEAMQQTVMIHWLEAGRAACQGMFRAAAGATLAGAMPEPPGAPPNAAELRFAQRFAAFQGVFRPEPIVYQQYADAMDLSGVTSEGLFQLARDGLLQAHNHARALLAAASARLTPCERAQLGGLQQMALRNAMALQVLAQARHSGDTSLRMAWEFSHHPWFPVISVKR